MANTTKTYTDLDLSFTMHPISGDVSIKTDEAAIKSAIKNLIMTRPTEHPFNYNFGLNIKSMLFENISPLSIASTKRVILNTIANFEPRVKVLDVKIIPSSDMNEITITIIFSIIGKFEPVGLSLALERTR